MRSKIISMSSSRITNCSVLVPLWYVIQMDHEMAKYYYHK